MQSKINNHYKNEYPTKFFYYADIFLRTLNFWNEIIHFHSLLLFHYSHQWKWISSNDNEPPSLSSPSFSIENEISGSLCSWLKFSHSSFNQISEKINSRISQLQNMFSIQYSAEKSFFLINGKTFSTPISSSSSSDLFSYEILRETLQQMKQNDHLAIVLIRNYSQNENYSRIQNIQHHILFGLLKDNTQRFIHASNIIYSHFFLLMSDLSKLESDSLQNKIVLISSESIESFSNNSSNSSSSDFISSKVNKALISAVNEWYPETVEWNESNDQRIKLNCSQKPKNQSSIKKMMLRIKKQKGNRQEWNRIYSWHAKKRRNIQKMRKLKYKRFHFKKKSKKKSKI